MCDFEVGGRFSVWSAVGVLALSLQPKAQSLVVLDYSDCILIGTVTILVAIEFNDRLN